MIRLIICTVIAILLFVCTFFIPPTQWYIVSAYILMLSAVVLIGFSYILAYRFSVYISVSVGFFLYLFWQGIFSFEFVGLLILSLLTSEVMYRIGIRMIQ